MIEYSNVDDTYAVYLISGVILTSMIMILAACLCCKKQLPKNELLGLEGMVKLTNPDDAIINNANTVVTVEQKLLSNENESKRSSNAPHRSLPDIPIAEPFGDNNSELYATVGDKVQVKPQGTSPTLSLKKQASVSQHSSLSQADDVSSPYTRVRSPPHAYDRLRPTEHPYAQVSASNINNTPQVVVQNESSVDGLNPISRRESNQSLLGGVNNDGSAHEIPAASAIAGRISASQELPYMTPPIVQPPVHFSGDSQDSSKGYTSISVREPLANIIAQTNQNNAQTRRQELSDSHYATVSDDSDEMYAAIDDPNNQVDLYTSGSETYAQIQPLQNPQLTISVEINTPSVMRTIDENSVVPPVQQTPNNITTSVPISTTKRLSGNIILGDESSNPATTDNLRTANVHSRQASSSSCTSSVGNIGSPKPEKRQANSPLPPTPKNLNQASANLSKNSLVEITKINEIETDASSSAAKKKQSPSKDLEGMYAKVMKKNKNLSNLPSQNSSPIMVRKNLANNLVSDTIQNSIDVYVSDPDVSKEVFIPDYLNNSITASPGKSSIKSVKNFDNNYETIEDGSNIKNRGRSNSYHNKDPGYETIPGDRSIINNRSDRKSADYAQILQKTKTPAQGIQKVSQNSLDIFHNTIAPSINEPGYESLPDQSLTMLNDPGYETVTLNNVKKKLTSSDYDPNYEVLRPNNLDNIIKDKTVDVDGYSKIIINNNNNNNNNTNKISKIKSMDLNDGYSSIKSIKKELSTLRANEIDNNIPITNETEPGYSSLILDKNHDYASIKDKQNLNNNSEDDVLYSSIPNSVVNPPYSTISETVNSSSSTINQTTTTVTTSPGYSSISETRSTDSASTNSDNNQSDFKNSKVSQNTTMTTTNTSSTGKLSSNSNYESLTGSETEQNNYYYESVKYLDSASNKNKSDNPYEILHNEKSNSPDDENSEKIINNAEEVIATATTTTTTSSTPDNLEVGDYFQV